MGPVADIRDDQVNSHDHRRPYTKADMPNPWVNALRLAFFVSAIEGTVVTRLLLAEVPSRIKLFPVCRTVR